MSYRTIGFLGGPVVQSVVSLTSSLRVIWLTVLVDLIYNILIFFAEKMWVAFALQKLLTYFQHICVSLDVNLNESLTNDVVSFEQLGPGYYHCRHHILLFKCSSSSNHFSRENKNTYMKTLEHTIILVWWLSSEAPHCANTSINPYLPSIP